MAKLIEASDPKRTLERCEGLGLGSDLLASCLAVNPKTVQRWRDGSVEPNEAGLRALEKLDGISRLATRLFKAAGRAAWFQTPNDTLGGERPAELLARGELEQVRNVLGMLEWGLYS